MKFGKTLIALAVVLMLVPAVLAVSMDTDVQGASIKGYGTSGSMSVEYHEASEKGLATITLTEAPGASQVTVQIGTQTILNLKASKELNVVLSPLDVGTYPVLVTENGVKIADCSLVVAMYYPVTVTSGTGGSASANYEEAPAGTTVTLKATPSAGYLFDRWEISPGTVTIANDMFTMPAADVTVNAVFKEVPPVPTMYNVQILTVGGGSAIASPSSAAEGTVVTLTAIPDQGYVLDEWVISPNTVTINDGKFTMPAENVTVMVKFKPASVPVTGVIISDSELNLDIGDSKTLIATVVPSDATDRSVTWSSSNDTIVSVADGAIKAVGSGTATITVTTTDGGFTATCVVSVNPETYVIEPSTSGQVTKAAIDQAIASVNAYKEQGLKQDVIISVTGNTVTMPADSAKELLDLVSKVTIGLSKGSVTVSKDSIPGLQTGDDLTIVIQDTEIPSGIVLPDGSVVVDVSMLLGETKVTSFDSPISISIPVPTGSDPSKLKVYYLSDDGKAKDMKATYDSASDAMVFTTDHLSIYAVATSATTPGGDDGGDSPQIAVYVAIAFVALVLVLGLLAYVIKKR